MPGLTHILGMVGRSVVDPREGAHEVLALGVPRRALGLIAALVVVLSLLVGELTAIALGLGDTLTEGLMAHPAVLAAMQMAVLIFTVVAVHRIGRLFGGTGRSDETLLLICWLQFIMICLQVIQTVAILVMPPLGAMIGFAAVALFLWLLTSFVAVLHGFGSRAKVFGVILAVALAFGVGLEMVLSALGVTLMVGMGGA